jgi:uncharacterized protein YndB with AHSA1/START domain
MNKIIHFVHIHASCEKVYRALTTEEGLAGWWSTAVSLQPGVGGVISFHFTGDFNPDMEMTKLEPSQRVEWKCIAGHDNWRDNTFSFELQDSDGETDLMFVQVYAQELSDEVYGTYNFNWGYSLGSLKSFCETGMGTPFEAS